MTANTPLHRLGLVEMLAAIEARRCDAADIVESCLDRIASVEPALGAWVHLEARAAWLARWQRFRSSHRDLPFHGLPMGVKDTIDVAGMKAERGSPIWRGRVATEDAACVARLAAAGLQVAGKTVTTEFAYFAPGKTRNPYHLDHTPGGSSSGSAAAVAAAMVPVALGSQTAASVIRPASYCGIAAHVATVGRFSLRGVMPLAWSFDAPGVLARSAADLERVHAALAGETAPPTAPPAPTRLLAFDARAFGEVDPAMGAAFESALAALARRGVDIRRPADPKAGAAWPALHQRWMADEAAQTLAFETATAPGSMSDELRKLVQDGAAVTPAERDELQARHD
ncbi:MAG: amidase, partial [Burkholderiales bacterium]|nr:amidase [Burkholderiales bacterium]